MTTFEGEIRELDLIEKMVDLWTEKFTGALRFEHDSTIKIIYFKEGNVLSASTNDRSDAVDEVLFRAGKITREHVRQALGKRKENETLGDALLALGFINRKELAWARRAQLLGIVRSLMSWTEGNFTIVGEYLPKREEGTVFYLPQLVLELIVTDTDRERVARALDQGNLVLQKMDSFDRDFGPLGLNEEAEGIIAKVDGWRSAADIAASTGTDAFKVFKLLYALLKLRMLTPKGQLKPQVSDEVLPGVVPPPAETFGEVDELPELDLAPAVVSEPVLEPPPVFPVQPTAAAQTVLPDAATVTRMTSQDSSDSLSFDEDLLRDDGPAGGYELTPAVSATQDEPLRPEPDPRFHRPSRNRSFGVLLLLVLVVLLGAAGWYGWQWWSRPVAPDASPVASRPAEVMIPPTPVEEATRPAPASVTDTVAPAPDTALPVTTTPSVPATATAPATTPATTPAQTAAPASVAPVVPTRPAPAPVTATSPPATPASSAATPAAPQDATRARYDAMAQRWASERRGAGYTVQVALVCQTDSITKALATGGDMVWFVPTQFRGRACYRLFWNVYSDRATAEAAISGVPQKLREGSVPAAVRVP